MDTIEDRKKSVISDTSGCVCQKKHLLYMPNTLSNQKLSFKLPNMNKQMKNQADLMGKRGDARLLIHNYPELMIE